MHMENIAKFVYESIENILKPKTNDEINDSLSNVSNEDIDVIPETKKQLKSHLYNYKGKPMRVVIGKDLNKEWSIWIFEYDSWNHIFKVHDELYLWPIIDDESNEYRDFMYSGWDEVIKEIKQNR